LENVPSVESTRVDIFFEMHYKVQTHEIMIPAAFEFENGEVSISAASMEETLKKFHDEHMDLFTFNKPDTEVEILGMQVDYWGWRPKPDLRITQTKDIGGAKGEASPTGHRKVYFVEDGGFHDGTPVFDGSQLSLGVEIAGPAIVEEPNTTIVVYPGMRLTMNRASAYDMTVE
jgi:N-methylhydantoinase A